MCSLRLPKNVGQIYLYASFSDGRGRSDGRSVDGGKERERSGRPGRRHRCRRRPPHYGLRDKFYRKGGKEGNIRRLNGKEAIQYSTYAQVAKRYTIEAERGGRRPLLAVGLCPNSQPIEEGDNFRQLVVAHLMLYLLT